MSEVLLYTAEGFAPAATPADKPAIVLDDMMLAANGMPTTGGSLMLKGYTSLFEAEAVTRLTRAGYAIAGKANIGEFNFDLLGETSYFGEVVDEAGNLTTATAEILQRAALNTPVEAVVGLDVNGTQRRSAALAHQVCLKPTYGIVSRYGTIAMACSGEAVSVSAATAAAAQRVLRALVGHDDKDGTTLPDAYCAEALDAQTHAIRTVGIVRELVDAADETQKTAIASAAQTLREAGIEVREVSAPIIARCNAAWNVLMCAELCNNVSRFDGVKYGYRSQDFMTIGELYTNSRTEAFGEYLKAALLFGSETLSDDNYMPVYDRSLRLRRKAVEECAALFASAAGSVDALVMPACSKGAFRKEDIENDPFVAFKENRFTAPASLTGFPAVVGGGVSVMGRMQSDAALLRVAGILQGEER